MKVIGKPFQIFEVIGRNLIFYKVIY